MGLLDDVVGAVSQQMAGKGSAQAGLMTAVMSLVNNPGGGGLAELVQRFRDKGLGDVASSWVSTGPNLPVSPQQIQDTLGREHVQQIAQQAGVSPDAASAGLASLLPTIVDRLTPDGNLPSMAALEEGVKQIKSKFFGG